MSNFQGTGFISSLIKSFENGLDIEEFSQVTGDSDYDKLTYPIAQFYPDQSTYNGDLEYEDSHTIFFIFESGKRGSKIFENSQKVEKALDNLQDELMNNDIVKEAKPQNFRFRVGENNNNLLDIIEVEVGVTKFERFR